MAATRTQIYLTTEQRERLDALARQHRKPLAELVRAAVDDYLEHTPSPHQALDATFGVLPDLDVPPRSEWDRA
ncbi:MAG TPA: ribbon-helix-helix domain-containing protein [Conexibacter sp.]|nr:ribbon-helix-helix domain-containing protein [Conexibacter sp.]